MDGTPLSDRKALEDLVEAPRRLLFHAHVRLGVPYLGVINGPDDHGLTIEPGVGGELCGDPDAALTIDTLAVSPRPQLPLDPAGAGVPVRLLQQRGHELVPVLLRPQCDTALGPLREHDLVVCDLVPQPRWDDETPLGIDRVTNGPRERQTVSPRAPCLGRWRDVSRPGSITSRTISSGPTPSGPSAPPLWPTLLHFPPLERQPRTTRPLSQQLQGRYSTPSKGGGRPARPSPGPLRPGTQTRPERAWVRNPYLRARSARATTEPWAWRRPASGLKRDAAGGGKAQILNPLRVDPLDRNHDPNTIVGPAGRVAQPHAYLRRVAVLLARVALPARRYDVVPRVAAAAALGDDVVDVLGLTPAVLALERVPHQHRPPGQGRPAPVGNLDEVVQAHDAGGLEGETLRAKDVAVRVQHLGLSFEGKNQRPPVWNHAQRLVGSVENERSSQGPSSI